jgi:anti-sigma-K factor RskA
LSQRIRHATADERAGRPTGWLSGWRPVAAAGAMAAVVALAIAVRTAPVKDTRALPASVVSDVSTGASSDDAVWTSMEQMAARLSPDDVHALVATPPELIPTVSDLSAKEREVFVTLLGSELNGDVQ